MSNFKAILKQLSESKEVIEEAKDDIGGVVIDDKGTVIKVGEADRKRVKKVVDKFKAANPSAGTKVLCRVAGCAVKLKGMEAGEIIKAYEMLTSDAYKEFLSLGKASAEK
jgi:hypothetical protein